MRSLSLAIAFILMLCGQSFALDQVKNFTKTTLIQGYPEGSTVFNVAPGTGAKHPEAPYRLAVWDCTTYQSAEDDPDAEIVLVTNKATDTLTVIRGYENTVAKSHNTPGKQYCVIQPFSAGLFNDLNAKIEAGAGGPQDILNVVAVDLRSSLASAVSDIGSSKKVLRITSDATTAANIAFPDTMTVWIECSGHLGWSDGVFVDFDRPEQIKAGNCQIFDAKAGVRFAKPGVVNPAWWGDKETATSTEAYTAIRQAIDSMAVGTTRANVLKFSAGVRQVSDVILSNSRNFTIKGESEASTVLQFTAVGSGKHGFACSGVTKQLRAEDITINTASALTLDNAQAGISCDTGAATLAAGTRVEVERVTMSGWNRGLSCDGGNTFMISLCEMRLSSVILSGVNSSSPNYSLYCMRVSLCVGEVNTLDGAGKSASALYATSAVDILFNKNSATNFGTRGLVARTDPDSGSHPSPRVWNLNDNRLSSNSGSILIQLSQGYEVPLVSINGTVIDADSGGGADNTAILVSLAGTSRLRTFLANGVVAKSLSKRVMTFNGVAGTTLDRVEAMGLNFSTWSTGSSTTYAAIDTNSTGTKISFAYSGNFDGASSGRSVLGASFESYWVIPPQAVSVYDTSTSVVSDNEFRVPIGASSQRASVGGVHYVKVSQTNTGANTTETTLDTVTVNAKALRANNGFHIHMSGAFAGNSNTKTLRFKWNGNTVVSNDRTAAPNGVNWVFDAYVMYSGDNQQVIDARLQIDCVNQTPYVGFGSADDDVNQSFLVTGQNGTSSNLDIRHNITVSKFLP